MSHKESIERKNRIQFGETMLVSLLRQSVAVLLVGLLSAPLGQAAPLQQPAPDLQSLSSNPAGSSQENAPVLESRPQSQPEQNPDQQPGNSNKPVGAATAPYEKATGVTASRPAGAVIAPAKQRRARTIFIRIAVVAGAAAAVGVVAALAHSSPSQPK